MKYDQIPAEYSTYLPPEFVALPQKYKVSVKIGSKRAVAKFNWIDPPEGFVIHYCPFYNSTNVVGNMLAINAVFSKEIAIMREVKNLAAMLVGAPRNAVCRD